MSTLSRRHQWTLRNTDTVACTCLPANARHLFGYQCIQDEEIRAWRARHPEATCGPTLAQMFTWMEKEFGGAQ